MPSSSSLTCGVREIERCGFRFSEIDDVDLAELSRIAPDFVLLLALPCDFRRRVGWSRRGDIQNTL